MNRRTFLRSSAATALGGAYLVGADGARAGGFRKSGNRPAAALDRIGVQLYTVRSLMQNDVPGTLEKVAAIGYDEVEFAGYYNHSPAEIKALIDDLGLTSPAVHVAYNLLKDDLDNVLEAAQVIGHEYVICPWLAPPQRTMEGYKEHVALFNQVGEKCKAAGVQFAYHNHDFEFESTDGQVHFDYLLTETDPELVKIELDLFWIMFAGQDPMAYFERYPGRFALCHVKDMAAEKQMVAVGQGQIDFGNIFAASEKAGLKHYFVEHDRPDDPMQSIETSYSYLNGLEF